MKSKLYRQKNQPVSVTNQLNMEALNGKMWVAGLAAKGESVAKYLSEAVSLVLKQIQGLNAFFFF